MSWSESSGCVMDFFAAYKLHMMVSTSVIVERKQVTLQVLLTLTGSQRKILNVWLC